MNDEQKKLIRELIEKNINQLIKAYKTGFACAMYLKYQAGNNKAFYMLTALIHNDFRQSLRMKDCMILNSQIQIMINQAIRKTLQYA